MPKLTLVDAAPVFFDLWPQIRELSADEQLAAWRERYEGTFPELWAMMVADYADQDLDWREIAKTYVLPFLSQRLPGMATAHGNLPDACRLAYERAGEMLGFASDAACVIYSGLGNGAGWVTRYADSPAILFGLENIAGEGWSAPETLVGLAAHEFGHLAHFEWRAEAGLEKGAGAWWQLYAEGFAQWCEHLIQGEPSWHMQQGGEDDWLAWCRGNRGWLAGEFLRRVDAGEEIRPFFGSWFDVRGRKQTGYFLGHEVMARLAGLGEPRDLALIDDVQGAIRPIVESLARQGAGRR